VEPYSDEELRVVVTNEFYHNQKDARDNSSDVLPTKTCVASLFALRSAVNDALRLESGAQDKLIGIRHLMRAARFFTNHSDRMPPLTRLVTAGRFFVADVLSPAKLAEVGNKWWSGSLQHLYGTKVARSEVRALFDDPTKEVCANWLQVDSSGLYVCKYSGVMVKPVTVLKAGAREEIASSGAEESKGVDITARGALNSNEANGGISDDEGNDGDDDNAREVVGELQRRSFLSVGSANLTAEEQAQQLALLRKQAKLKPVASLVKNIARTFASINATAPLLLTGSVGCGKTAVIQEVCALLGVGCVRVNFSSSTTLDQLFGTVVPRCDNGARVFEFVPGTLTRAVRNGDWLLFDEVNLAPADVLDGLAPLLDVASEKFLIPGTEEVLDMTGIRIFAAMNPTSVGNRSKLPRSIANLFTEVILDGYSKEELRTIIPAIFKKLVDNNTITGAQLTSVFAVHNALRAKLAAGEIGAGGRHDVNLRDLSKLKDVLAANGDAFRQHYAVYMSDPNTDGAGDTTITSADDNDIRLLAVRKFTELVYARRFASLEDQAQVHALIERGIPMQGHLAALASDTVDTDVPNVVRIASVYLPTGNGDVAPEELPRPLSHTPQTVQQLEILAAASQSTRPVLIEGDTCSRKTALVRELARLAKRRLVVIPMHENLETGDLVGQWLPVRASQGLTLQWKEARNVLQSTRKRLLLFVLPFLFHQHKHVPREFVASMVHISKLLQQSTDLERTGNKVAVSEMLLTGLQSLETLLDGFVTQSQLRVKVQDVCKNMLTRSKQARKQLQRATQLLQQAAKQSEEGNSGSMHFDFVLSQLVKAMLDGSWVLMDNINSAPPDVLERLNSVLEADPELSLYEHSDGRTISRTGKRDGVDKLHPNFRIFATSNMRRIGSHKLSGAMLNRVIRIWLPKLDEGFTCDEGSTVRATPGIESHDTFDIAAHILKPLHGAVPLATLVLRYHACVLELVETCQVRPMAGFSITFRNILFACYTAVNAATRFHISPVYVASAFSSPLFPHPSLTCVSANIMCVLLAMQICHWLGATPQLCRVLSRQGTPDHSHESSRGASEISGTRHTVWRWCVHRDTEWGPLGA